MRERLNTGQLKTLICQLKEDLSTDIDRLGELDAVAGDGDLGVTVDLGMQAVTEGFDSIPDENLGALLSKSGMNFNRAASSTFGTICATALMRAGKAASGKQEISTEDIIEILDASEKGIRERGKAKPGDRTVLDALVPMKEAFTKGIQSGSGLENAFSMALEATEAGVESTKEMKATMGRARWLSDRAKGHVDPGAMALLLMLRSIINNWPRDNSE